MLRYLRMVVMTVGISSSLCVAQTHLTEVRATGTGSSDTDALSNALSKAAGEINGAEVSSETQVKSVTAEGVVHNDNTGDGESFAAAVSQSSSTSFKAAGQVADYKILSSSRDSMGVYHVSVIAHVASYSAPGDSDTRRALAILPPRISGETYDFYGPISASELAQNVGSALESEIVQSRRFAVLDRTTLGDSVAELNLIGSNLTGPVEKAKLQKIKGADYLLIPTIKTAAYKVNEHTLASTGQVRRNESADLTLEVRVIVPATAEIKFSEAYSFTRPLGRDAMVNAIAHITVGDLVSRIYPVKVVAVLDGGRVVVNEGGRSIQVGELFSILQASSKVLKDPYTGESLGAVEEQVGEAAVERVDGKISYLRLTSGDATKLKPGMFARLDWNAMNGAAAAVAAPAPSSPPPGVRLPIDH